MKIGILTYSDTRNYGAVLQAYALCRTINELGSECEIIDYKCEAITERYRIKKLREQNSIKGIIKYLLTINMEKNRKVIFDKFHRERYKLSNRSYDMNSIKESNSYYDKFISGSDQVWNLELSGMDYTYFLDFAKENKGKYSYAASFGSAKIDENNKSKLQKLIERFDDISIREYQGAKIVKSLIDKNVTTVLDPTFLLNKAQWSEIIESAKVIEDYILVYVISTPTYLFEFVKNLSKATGYKVIYINEKPLNKMGMENVRTATPEEFLGYIKNAKYVVTTSFHGMAFSINFEKNFFYETSRDVNAPNSRLENLSQILGLKDREIINGKNDNINLDINYEKVRENLNKEIEKSLNYLKEIIR